MRKVQKKRLQAMRWLACLAIIIGSTLSPMSQGASAVSYTDVDPSNTHYANIMAAFENGFMTSYPDGSFKPNLQLSRANVVKSLGKYVLKTSGKDLVDFDVSGVVPFNDVPPTHPDYEMYRYSLIVKQAGIFSGSNNYLMPMNLMSHQHMAKVLVGAFALEHVEGGPGSKVIDNHLALEEFR
ncbi:S-layer homology domain-containing protein [Sporosarcina sp. FSL K6-1522]|uniref:S-layer homology domain-containing protein n=1 Tax=Sporosarcina sp. FSL K6-1522 TaxID=2921554 RepID=UPI00315A52C4